MGHGSWASHVATWFWDRHTSLRSILQASVATGRTNVKRLLVTDATYMSTDKATFAATSGTEALLRNWNIA